MQKNIYYIIGVLVVGIIGVIAYVLSAPTTSSNTQSLQDNSTQVTQENSITQTQTSTDANASLQNQTQDANVATTTNKETKNMQKEKYTVTMETNKGTIVLELDSKIAPKTVANFVKLSEAGFYNGVKFHRVIKDFMIQAGDPQSKDDKLMQVWGTGGPGYKFEDEIFDKATYTNGYKRGILAMANSGPNTNGSQFFIMHKDVPLPPSYTIFGHVVRGIETVDAIANVKTTVGDRPVDAVVISKVSVQ